MPVTDPDLLAILVRAHSILSTQDECLSTMLDDKAGAVGPWAATALAARACVASAVRCYFEAVEQWEPAPLWQVLRDGAADSKEDAALPAALVRR